MMFEFTSYYLDDFPADGRIFDVFRPEKVTRDTAIFLVHGGGWRAGERAGYLSGWHRIMAEWNRMGFLCATTDYRLRDVTALDQLADIRESYARFLGLLKKWGRPVRVAVFGESAGAHLASLLALAAPGECGDKFIPEEWTAPECAALQSCPASFEPWEDIFPGILDSMRGIAGESYEKNPELYRRLSMKTYLRKGNPRLFFLEAGNEHMFPSEFNRETVEVHRKLGIPSKLKEYPRAEHGFFYSLDRRCQREAFKDITTFFLEGK